MPNRSNAKKQRYKALAKARLVATAKRNEAKRLGIPVSEVQFIPSTVELESLDDQNSESKQKSPATSKKQPRKQAELERKRQERMDRDKAIELKLSLQAEFNDVTSGLIELQDAVLISQLASEKNQTSEDFYQEYCESEQARLRLEEEKTFDESIASFILLIEQNFPLILPLPKRKEIIANIEILFAEARAEKFGGVSAGTGWSLLESVDGIKNLFPCSIKNNIEVKQEPLEGAIEQIIQPIDNTEEMQMSLIGSEVETISGHSGVLICSSGMGLTPMDLFNDILTSRRDLENFLNDYNCKESDNISLSIKAYLKFCKITKTPHWVAQNIEEVINVGDNSFEIDLSEENPSNSDDFSRPFYEENDFLNDTFEEHIPDSIPESKTKKRKKKDVDWCESEDEYMGGLSTKRPFQKTKCVRTSTNRATNPQLRLTENERRGAKKLSDEEIVSVLKCCDICYPNNQEYQNVISEIPTPKLFDHVMSKHLKEDHEIIDTYQQQIDLFAGLEQKMENKEFTKRKDGYACKKPNCTYTSYFWFCKQNEDDIVHHAEWHRQLDSLNIPYLTGTEEHPTCIFPCPEETCRYGAPFLHFKGYIDHKAKYHPDFNFKCRYPMCDYNTPSSAALYTHISSRHKRGSHSCDVCGETYVMRKSLEEHMLKHDPDTANRFPCEFCGKTFHTEYKAIQHKRQVHIKTLACPLCPEIFHRKKNVEAHLVHVHGQERKHECDVCGAKFIQRPHLLRHLKNFHGDTAIATLTRIRQRGPNKS